MLDLDPRVRPCAAEISPALDRLSGTPGHERRPASVRAASPRRTVGREHERRALRAAFDAVVAGNGRILCVTGEPGIGKTTLIDELLAEVTRETPGCLVARGRSSERLAGTEAYLPWLEAIEDLLRSGAGSRIAATLRLVAPSWHGLVSSSHGAPETAVAAADAGSSDRLRRELAAFLQEVTRTRPLVLSFDDVHWADLSTLDLLSHIASRLPAVRLLIMLAYRPSELRETREPFLQLLRDLQARGICHDIPLEFLSRADVARYLELTCPGHRFPDDLPDLIHARTEGSPLFVTDLVAYLINRDVLAPMDGVWALHRPLSDIDHGLPESIRSMIERRIAQIEERDRWLLTVASVQGYAFDSAVLARALAIPASELEERLEALERLHAFVRSLEERELPDGTLSLRYRFQHQLYQNALYASLRPTRRSELSRSIAEALIELYGEAGIRVMDLANLFETARDWSRAVHYYEIAVRSAATIFAYHEVITLTGRGRTLITRLPDAAERDVRELALLEVLGPALSATRGYAVPGVVETYTRARELAQRSGTGQQLFTVLYNLWLVHDLRGQQHEARRLAEECVALAEGLDDSGTRVLASAAAGETRLWSADFEGALVALERGLEHYDPERHHSLAILYQYDPGVVSWVMAAHARWQLGYPDRAMQLVAQAIDVADRYAQPHSRALAWSHASLLHHLRGEIQPARARADTVQALASDRGFRFWEGYAEILIGRTLVGEGAVDEGFVRIERGIAAYRETGSEVELPFFQSFLAEAWLARGRPDEALAEIADVVRYGEQTGTEYYQPELKRLQGLALLLMGQPEQAEASFRDALKSARNRGARMLELRAAVSASQLWRSRGKAAEAAELLRSLLDAMTEGVETSDLKSARALLEEIAPVAVEEAQRHAAPRGNERRDVT
jgi:predicted ATPase